MGDRWQLYITTRYEDMAMMVENLKLIGEGVSEILNLLHTNIYIYIYIYIYSIYTQGVTELHHTDTGYGLLRPQAADFVEGHFSIRSTSQEGSSQSCKYNRATWRPARLNGHFHPSSTGVLYRRS